MVGNAVPDVTQYFNVDPDITVPLIIGHEPSKDAKYRSNANTAMTTDALQDFVTGVVSGVVKKVIKSEPLPKNIRSNKKSNVIKAVGLNVVEIVSAADQDVLLEVYAPWCAHCKKIAPTIDVLSKAVQGEKRISIVQVDGSANDLPAHWKVKNLPALLYFPKKDKPYKDGTPVPRPYWDAGHSLQELVSFLTKHSSFDSKSLKVATTEQLGTLLGDEELLRSEYEMEERWRERNKDRVKFENEIMDYLLGEVVFDGTRVYAGAAGLLITYAMCLTIYLVLSALLQSKKVKVKTSSKQK
jgi:thiol-disulfide isomerase/thioredoxin